MQTPETRAGLESLTKKELIATFSSFELKIAGDKAELVQAIMERYPPKEEVQAFYDLLDAKKITEPEPEPERYIVAHPIKEDGHLYERGDMYKGKNIERFLKGKQIRIK